MPDTPETSDNSSVPESLENLLKEAESTVANAVVDAVSNQASATDHPRPCNHTEIPVEAKSKCPTCLWFFCDECASHLDPAYCKLCLNEPDAALRELPLIDTDGVTHTGRVLTPQPDSQFFRPRFGTLSKTISEMSMYELEAHIDHYRELVKQAEKALDFRRVVLGATQLELAQRQDGERRRLRANKTKHPIRTVSLNKATGKQTTKSASLTQMLEMLKQLDALQKLKQQKKTQPSTVAVSDAKPQETK